MKAKVKIILVLSAVLLLMSVDFTYEWYAPISSQGELVPWYSTIGLQSGIVGLFNCDIGSQHHLNFQLHHPAFFPFPIVIWGGPEGGEIGIAVWFSALLGFLIGYFKRGRRFR